MERLSDPKADIARRAIMKRNTGLIFILEASIEEVVMDFFMRIWLTASRRRFGGKRKIK
jgi:hypothetical protein